MAQRFNQINGESRETLKILFNQKDGKGDEAVAAKFAQVGVHEEHMISKFFDGPTFSNLRH